MRQFGAEIIKIKNKEMSRIKNLIKSKIFPFLLQLSLDVIGIIIWFILCFSYFLNFKIEQQGETFSIPIEYAVLVGVALLIYWLGVFFFTGQYRNWYEKSPFDEFYSVIRMSFFGFLIMLLPILVEAGSTPKLHLIVYYGLFLISVYSGRIISRYLQKKFRMLELISIPTVIIGTYRKAHDFHKKTKIAKSWGYRSIGIVLTSESELELWKQEGDKSVPMLGTIEDLQSILDKHKPSEVIISTEKPKHSLLVEIVSQCADNNLKVNIEPDLYDIFTGQTRAQNLYGIPLIEVSTQLLKPWQEVIKRIFDIAFSLMVLLIGLPIWLLVALIIKMESKGPVFYTQPRVGKDSKVFKIYKFRSMVTDADKQKQQWTSVNDPRVTKFGWFTRKTHLDEVPQFLNVLIGDMSVVGPRPEQPKYVEEFSKEVSYYKRRLKVRPGITGWWQVKYTAHELNVEEIKNRLKDDFYYIENMSLKLDIEIIIRTVFIMFKLHGQA